VIKYLYIFIIILSIYFEIFLECAKIFLVREVFMKTLKSFMLVIFSACFLLGGLFLLMPKKERASAETTIIENVENNLPEYVGVSANGDETVTKMIENDIFLFNNNSLTINFKMNGNSVNEGGGEIYDYVF